MSKEGEEGKKITSDSLTPEKTAALLIPNQAHLSPSAH
jgi:hypothetical protein